MELCKIPTQLYRIMEYCKIRVQRIQTIRQFRNNLWGQIVLPIQIQKDRLIGKFKNNQSVIALVFLFKNMTYMIAKCSIFKNWFDIWLSLLTIKNEYYEKDINDSYFPRFRNSFYDCSDDKGSTNKIIDKKNCTQICKP